MDVTGYLEHAENLLLQRRSHLQEGRALGLEEKDSWLRERTPLASHYHRVHVKRVTGASQEPGTLRALTIQSEGLVLAFISIAPERLRWVKRVNVGRRQQEEGGRE